MAKLRCGLLDCQHNSKKTPGGYGVCRNTDKVYLNFMQYANNGDTHCVNFLMEERDPRVLHEPMCGVPNAPVFTPRTINNVVSRRG